MRIKSEVDPVFRKIRKFQQQLPISYAVRINGVEVDRRNMITTKDGSHVGPMTLREIQVFICAALGIQSPEEIASILNAHYKERTGIKFNIDGNWVSNVARRIRASHPELNGYIPKAESWNSRKPRRGLK